MKNIKSIAAGLLMTAATLGLAATSAHAVVITLPSDPLLTGSSLITFSEVADGTLDPTISAVTFDGIGGTIITNAATLLNSPSDGGALDGINFDVVFGTAVNAFGGEFSKINRSVTIDAFNGLTLLGSTSFDPGSPDTTVFRGLGGFGSGITNARISITGLDIIRLDNFRFGGIAAHYLLYATNITDGTEVVPLCWTVWQRG